MGVGGAAPLRAAPAAGALGHPFALSGWIAAGGADEEWAVRSGWVAPAAGGRRLELKEAPVH